MKHYLLIYIAAILITGCENPDNHPPQDKLLASAGNRMLYLSDLSSLIPEGSNKADSTSIANHYIENWIRESILLNEAERNLEKQLDIDKLVSDYRESLLIYNYEKKLVEEQLDTIISQEQKEDFYLQNKDTYKLVNPIVQGIYVVAPNDAPGLSQFKRNWIKENIEEMKKYAENNNLDHRLDESNWITFTQFKEFLPEDLFTDSELKSKKIKDKLSEGNQYFVKILDYLDENEIAPLSYINDKVEKVILYNRKVNLLEYIKEQIYQSELKLNKIKIYTN